MRRKFSIGGAAAVLVFLIGCAAFVRACLLHAAYPDPEIVTYEYGDSLRVGGYSIRFDGWEWGDETLLKERFPEYVLIPEEENREEVRVGLFGLSICKEEADAGPLDLTRFAFSSGAWGNQYDMELFYLLNPDADSLRPDPAVGEPVRIWLPMVMQESHFPAGRWEWIDRRDFYLDLSFYPEQVRLCCPR